MLSQESRSVSKFFIGLMNECFGCVVVTAATLAFAIKAYGKITTAGETAVITVLALIILIPNTIAFSIHLISECQRYYGENSRKRVAFFVLWGFVSIYCAIILSVVVTAHSFLPK